MDSIIFDVDGTLWDSTEIVAQAWTWYLQTREHMDITLTSQRLMSLFGQLLPDIARQLFPDLSEAEQLRIIDGCCQAEHEALLKKCAPLYEGLEHTLQELGKKYPLFIVSNCQDGYIPCFLEAHGLAPLFADWECSGHTGKSKGENIRMVIERNRLDRAVYLGDTLGDQRAAEEAGIPFLHAAYGFGQPDKPVPSLKAFSDLPSLLSYILR